ncbi:hypothetical protein PGTUg99_037011 [Puccinia graminis f. sp. tritici]|uniref:Uncharacterized protein n=1 Tax=Puccinia graminis f. sp. tritici TaxID=56615 RepID=A0A5B0SLW6_PUCGR|nr:hypothetical protein PGTUg99_037011 [Puccinia graminis f. sp. tritici]
MFIAILLVYQLLHYCSSSEAPVLILSNLGKGEALDFVTSSGSHWLRRRAPMESFYRGMFFIKAGIL